MNVSVAMSKEECAQKLQARFVSAKIIGHNPHFGPYYGMQSYGKTFIYNPYWQPNIYRSMQVFPNLKRESHQVCKIV